MSGMLGKQCVSYDCKPAAEYSTQFPIAMPAAWTPLPCQLPGSAFRCGEVWTCLEMLLSWSISHKGTSMLGRIIMRTIHVHLPAQFHLHALQAVPTDIAFGSRLLVLNRSDLLWSTACRPV